MRPKNPFFYGMLHFPLYTFSNKISDFSGVLPEKCKVLWSVYERCLFCLIFSLMVSVSGVIFSGGRAISGTADLSTTPSLDGTMLMFVGEALDVVTVASRTPESPSSAPAMVRVIGRDEMKKFGYRTLAELLSAQPGFFMMDQGAGSQPFLRGIANGILILYDGVPIPTNGNRSYYPLDNELSLNSVKQVEIIRGPGSVLWGADAFAGIVNVVPLTGRDAQNREVEMAVGSGSAASGFVGQGGQAHGWDAYLSAYAARNYTNEETFIDAKYSEKDQNWHFSDAVIDMSEYYEMTFNAHYGDHISLSGRLSDFNTPYTLSAYYNGTPIVWSSEKKAPVNYIKFNYANHSGRSHLNVNGYYQDATYSQINANVAIDESFDVFYGEVLWDRRLFEKGLLTTGISYRESHVDGALIEDKGFIPEILLNEDFDASLPIEPGSYQYMVKSLFAQYRHPFVWGEIWAGCRIDDNSMYDDYAPSITMGLNFPLTDQWRMKAVMGTGYRTAYSQQLSESDSDRTRDHVATWSLQTEWSGGDGDFFSATAYYSRLSNNVQIDPIAGDSSPADIDFFGAEIAYRKRFMENLEGYLSLSKVFYDGDVYHYTVLGQTYIRPDGSVEPTYERWAEPYESGADLLCSSGIYWRFHPKLSVSMTADWTSDIPYSYEENTIVGVYDNPVRLDGAMIYRILPENKLTLTLGCKNFLDGEFHYPGAYGSVSGDPLTVYLLGEYRF